MKKIDFKYIYSHSFLFSLKLAIENNEKLINEIIQQIYQSFEQLRQSLLNFESTNKISSPEVCLNDLNQIFNRLIDLKLNNYSDVMNMFEIILKNYLDLIDMNQFIDIIAHRYACKSNIVFASFFESFNPEGALELTHKMPIKVRQQTYYRILDQICSSKRIHSFLNNELLISIDDKHIKRIVSNFCGLILILVLKILNSLNVKLLDIELKKYQNNLFIPFIKFIDEYFLTSQCSQHDVLIRHILEFLHMVSDQPLTIPIFINAKCPQACLRWLSLPYLNAYEYIHCLQIVYNIARHDQGVIILNECQCYSVLMQFNTDILNNQMDFIIDKNWYEDLQLIYFMTIVLIIDPNELGAESTDWYITYRLLPVISTSMLSRTFRHRKFHISEFMIILMKLCTNDNFIHSISTKKKYELSQDVFDSLDFLLHCVEIERVDYNFLSLDVLTITASANILWSISFHDRYKDKLIENIEIINRLVAFESSDTIDKILPNIYIPRHMSPLKRAMDGILQNLYPKSNADLDIGSSTKSKSVGSLMISYSHVDIDFCRQLYDTFSTIPELSISIDFNSGKYSWKDIAQTIVQSDLVVFLLSQNFFNSKSCRQEFIYVTDTLKKPFIPVFIDTEYEAIEWLKIRINEVKHICFDENDFLNICNQLISMIKENLSLNITVTKNTFDIEQWFHKNNLMLELQEFYQFQTGNELLLYAEAILGTLWTKEYERIRTRFEEKFKQKQLCLSPHDFLKFINALNALKSKNLSSTA
ncbi:unnamed protein product [Rotaria magnacalcarata]|uniref:TIR domain-containing protein n=1 Tax=Rotaria magnacalcarata TaxID=392030 RepID=A0A819EWA6_9BILA|nr:unnamed protein product [Rotaria magnacalcarata]